MEVCRSHTAIRNVDGMAIERVDTCPSLFLDLP